MMVDFFPHRLIYSVYCNYYPGLFSNELQRSSALRICYLGDASYSTTTKKNLNVKWTVLGNDPLMLTF